MRLHNILCVSGSSNKSNVLHTIDSQSHIAGMEGILKPLVMEKVPKLLGEISWGSIKVRLLPR